LANEIIVYMRILWNFHRKNGWDIENFALMYKILLNPSRIRVTVGYVILRQEWTENNLRKWIVRYDQCQRRVADKTCRFQHCFNSQHVIVTHLSSKQEPTTPRIWKCSLNLVTLKHITQKIGIVHQTRYIL
jgi:hypothetical protein